MVLQHPAKRAAESDSEEVGEDNGHNTHQEWVSLLRWVFLKKRAVFILSFGFLWRMKGLCFPLSRLNENKAELKLLSSSG